MTCVECADNSSSGDVSSDDGESLYFLFFLGFAICLVFGRSFMRSINEESRKKYWNQLKKICCCAPSGTLVAGNDSTINHYIPDSRSPQVVPVGVEPDVDDVPVAFTVSEKIKGSDEPPTAYAV